MAAFMAVALLLVDGRPRYPYDRAAFLLAQLVPTVGFALALASRKRWGRIGAIVITSVSALVFVYAAGTDVGERTAAAIVEFALAAINARVIVLLNRPRALQWFAAPTAPRSQSHQLPTDSDEPSTISPVIWNPNAAVLWSLLFTPAFGTYLHMRNWRALAEPARAASARIWLISSLVIIAIHLAISIRYPDSRGATRAAAAIGTAFLLVWYVAAARAQATYVHARFGKSYVRASWRKPMLFVVLTILAVVVTSYMLALVLQLH